MSKEQYAGYIKKETMYVVIGVSLLIGFLGGVVFTIYKAPGGGSAQVQQQVATGQQESEKLAALEQQAQATPQDPEIWVHLGNAYFDADMPAKAIPAYRKFLDLVPGNADVLTDLGVMYRRNGQPDQALDVFNQAIAVSPKHEQARFNKGVVFLFDKKDQAGAIKIWKELLGINPMAKAPNGQLLKDFIENLQKNKPLK